MNISNPNIANMANQISKMSMFSDQDPDGTKTRKIFSGILEYLYSDGSKDVSSFISLNEQTERILDWYFTSHGIKQYDLGNIPFAVKKRIFERFIELKRKKGSAAINYILMEMFVDIAVDIISYRIVIDKPVGASEPMFIFEPLNEKSELSIPSPEKQMFLSKHWDSIQTYIADGVYPMRTNIIYHKVQLPNTENKLPQWIYDLNMMDTMMQSPKMVPLYINGITYELASTDIELAATLMTHKHLTTVEVTDTIDHNKLVEWMKRGTDLSAKTGDVDMNEARLIIKNIRDAHTTKTLDIHEYIKNKYPEFYGTIVGSDVGVVDTINMSKLLRQYLNNESYGKWLADTVIRKVIGGGETELYVRPLVEFFDEYFQVVYQETILDMPTVLERIDDLFQKIQTDDDQNITTATYKSSKLSFLDSRMIHFWFRSLGNESQLTLDSTAKYKVTLENLTIIHGKHNIDVLDDTTAMMTQQFLSAISVLDDQSMVLFVLPVTMQKIDDEMKTLGLIEQRTKMILDSEFVFNFMMGVCVSLGIQSGNVLIQQLTVSTSIASMSSESNSDVRPLFMSALNMMTSDMEVHYTGVRLTEHTLKDQYASILNLLLVSTANVTDFRYARVMPTITAQMEIADDVTSLAKYEVRLDEYPGHTMAYVVDYEIRNLNRPGDTYDRTTDYRKANGPDDSDLVISNRVDGTQLIQLVNTGGNVVEFQNRHAHMVESNQVRLCFGAWVKTPADSYVGFYIRLYKSDDTVEWPSITTKSYGRWKFIVKVIDIATTVDYMATFVANGDAEITDMFTIPLTEGQDIPSDLERPRNGRYQLITTDTSMGRKNSMSIADVRSKLTMGSVDNNQMLITNKSKRYPRIREGNLFDTTAEIFVNQIKYASGAWYDEYYTYIDGKSTKYPGTKYCRMSENTGEEDADYEDRPELATNKVDLTGMGYDRLYVGVYHKGNGWYDSDVLWEVEYADGTTTRTRFNTSEVDEWVYDSTVIHIDNAVSVRLILKAIDMDITDFYCIPRKPNEPAPEGLDRPRWGIYGKRLTSYTTTTERSDTYNRTEYSLIDTVIPGNILADPLLQDLSKWSNSSYHTQVDDVAGEGKIFEMKGPAGVVESMSGASINLPPNTRKLYIGAWVHAYTPNVYTAITFDTRITFSDKDGNYIKKTWNVSEPGWAQQTKSGWYYQDRIIEIPSTMDDTDQMTTVVPYLLFKGTGKFADLCVIPLKAGEGIPPGVGRPRNGIIEHKTNPFGQSGYTHDHSTKRGNVLLDTTNDIYAVNRGSLVPDGATGLMVRRLDGSADTEALLSVSMIKLPVGTKQLHFGCWIKLDDPSATQLANVSIKIEYADGDKVWVSTSTLKPTTGWQYVQKIVKATSQPILDLVNITAVVMANTPIECIGLFAVPYANWSDVVDMEILPRNGIIPNSTANVIPHAASSQSYTDIRATIGTTNTIEPNTLTDEPTFLYELPEYQSNQTFSDSEGYNLGLNQLSGISGKNNHEPRLLETGFTYPDNRVNNNLFAETPGVTWYSRVKFPVTVEGDSIGGYDIGKRLITSPTSAEFVMQQMPLVAHEPGAEKVWFGGWVYSETFDHRLGVAYNKNLIKGGNLNNTSELDHWTEIQKDSSAKTLMASWGWAGNNIPSDLEFSNFVIFNNLSNKVLDIIHEQVITLDESVSNGSTMYYCSAILGSYNGEEDHTEIIYTFKDADNVVVLTHTTGVQKGKGRSYMFDHADAIPSIAKTVTIRTIRSKGEGTSGGDAYCDAYISTLKFYTYKRAFTEDTFVPGWNYVEDVVENPTSAERLVLISPENNGAKFADVFMCPIDTSATPLGKTPPKRNRKYVEVPELNITDEFITTLNPE